MALDPFRVRSAAAFGFDFVIKLSASQQKHHEDGNGHALENRQAEVLKDEQNERADHHDQMNENFLQDRQTLRSAKNRIEDINNEREDKDVRQKRMLRKPVLHVRSPPFLFLYVAY
jgi:hypothetical protein